MALDPALKQKIDSLVSSDSVVLFMKGTRSFPQCGFSASVVNILNTLIPKYTTVNVLSDPDIRGGMKDYSDYGTGGCRRDSGRRPPPVSQTRGGPATLPWPIPREVSAGAGVSPDPRGP